MSDADPPPLDPHRPQPPARGGANGCLTAFLFLLGLVLLLPGVCVVVVLGSGVRMNSEDVAIIALPCFLATALGIWMIRAARRRK